MKLGEWFLKQNVKLDDKTEGEKLDACGIRKKGAV